MNYVAEILCNETGEIRDCEMSFDTDIEDWLDVLCFIWTDGNYGCDCNREIFFRRVRGESDEGRKCGDSAFKVMRLVLEDGTVIDPWEVRES